jgi:NADH-quinone oxidoreductase subunit C
MEPKEIHERLSAKFGGKILQSVLEAVDPYVVIETSAIADVCGYLKEDPELACDTLMCLSGVDTKEKLQIVYHIYSMSRRHRVVLKVETTREGEPSVPTVSHVWGTANFHEREAYDMFGFRFEGHPDLRRILCPDDWEGYPLRKDYKYPDFYRDIDNRQVDTRDV